MIIEINYNIVDLQLNENNGFCVLQLFFMKLINVLDKWNVFSCSWFKAPIDMWYI